ALDALTRLKAQGLVASLWTAHRPAILLVTHDVDEALRLADRVLVLDKGRIALDWPVDLERPRRHAQRGFAELRTGLLRELGVEEEEGEGTEPGISSVAGPGRVQPGAKALNADRDLILSAGVSL